MSHPGIQPDPKETVHYNWPQIARKRPNGGAFPTTTPAADIICSTGVAILPASPGAMSAHLHGTYPVLT